MKKNFFILGAILTLITACNFKAENIQNISVNDLEQVLNSNTNIQLLDVRTPEECTKGIIKNAIQINVTGDNFEKIALEKLDKTTPVYIYCRSGGRSKIASELLFKKGFQTYNILGGYMEWKEKIK